MILICSACNLGLFLEIDDDGAVADPDYVLDVDDGHVTSILTAGHAMETGTMFSGAEARSVRLGRIEG